jgi:hypothetical protein
MVGVKSSWTEKMQAASIITEVAGGLHEVQVEQLRLYGLAFSAAVKSATFDADHESKTIKYLVVIDPKLIENDIGKRVAVLKVAVAAIMRGWGATIRFRNVGTTNGDEDEE